MIKVFAIVESMIHINIKELRYSCKEGATAYETVKKKFTYKNPKFVENEKWGYSNYAVEKYLKTFEIHNGQIAFSRGCYNELIKHFKKFSIELSFIDRTLVCETVDFSQSNTIMRKDQGEFVSDLLNFDKYPYGCSGIAYTSFGKTLSLLEIAKIIAQPTLILVHTEFLQKQWIKEATDPCLFNLPKSRIGGVGGVFAGKKRRLGDLNICLYHSLMKQNHLDFFKDKIGCVLFDEGQKSPIEGVQKVINKTRSRYRYTASAELRRKDGKEFITFDTFGDIAHVAVEKASDSKIMSKLKLVKTPYSDYETKGDNNLMLTRMYSDKERNIFICRRAVKAVRQGRLVLIFTERKFHAAILYRMLSKAYKVEMLLGGVTESNFQTLECKKEVAAYSKHFDEHIAHKYAKYKDKKVAKQAKKKYISDHVTMAYLTSKKTMKMAMEYKTSFDSLVSLATKKKINIIIGTQKAEVGLSIRTLDHGIITSPIGNNDERFKQVKGRFERTYKQVDIDLFGCMKDVPTIDVLVDGNYTSINASDRIKNVWGDSVTKVKSKKTILRKRRK